MAEARPTVFTKNNKEGEQFQDQISILLFFKRVTLFEETNFFS